MDLALRHNGGRCVAGLVRGRMGCTKASTEVVSHSAIPQRPVDAVIFWHASPWDCLRRDPHFVAGRALNSGCLLAGEKSRWMVDGSLPGVGFIRHGAELSNLGAEFLASGIISSSRCGKLPISQISRDRCQDDTRPVPVVFLQNR